MNSAIRRVTCATIASILIMTNFGSSHAAGVLDLNQRIASPAGIGAMLSLRVPLGGRAATPDQVFVGLAAGPVWREGEAAPASLGRSYQVSTIELGRSLSGRRIARLGGIDFMNARPGRIAAEGGETTDEEGNEQDNIEGTQAPNMDATEGRNIGYTLFVVGLGALAVIGIAAAVDWARDCRDVPYCGLP